MGNKRMLLIYFVVMLAAPGCFQDPDDAVFNDSTTTSGSDDGSEAETPRDSSSLIGNDDDGRGTNSDKDGTSDDQRQSDSEATDSESAGKEDTTERDSEATDTESESETKSDSGIGDSDSLTQDSGSDTEKDCVTESYQQCGPDGHVHWYDSCGNQEHIVKSCADCEACENAECRVKQTNSYQQCGSDGHVHWYDSCGSEGETAETCEDFFETCTDINSIKARCRHYCEGHECWTVVPTGQKLCFDDDSTIDCPSFPCAADGSPAFCGQDSQYRGESRSFICTKDGKKIPCGETAQDGEIVADSATGLGWQRKWVFGKDYSWSGADSYCRGLDYGGHTDWRLPRYHELADVVNYGGGVPPIDVVSFSRDFPPDALLWTSSSRPDYPGYAWATEFSSGLMVHIYKEYNGEEKQGKAICVRGETVDRDEYGRFLEIVDQGEEIVVDLATGLYWQKEYSNDMTWSEGLKHCERLEYGVYDDWRLPNVNELRGLVSTKKAGSITSFPNTPGGTFWSSTSSIERSTDALGVMFEKDLEGWFLMSLGALRKENKTTPLVVRCVREEITKAKGLP